MRSVKKLSLVVAALMASSAMVQAADLLPPPVEELPPEVVVSHGSTSGWYIRGDIGYGKFNMDDIDYFQGPLLTGDFEQKDLDGTWSIQGGIGYQVTDYLRVDATLKYFGSADFEGSSAPAGSDCTDGLAPYGNFCTYDDDGELESLTLLMANAYVDLGTFKGVTPYVGAGIGGAHVSWGDLINDQTCVGSADDVDCSAQDFRHNGQSEWRFAWALHAGGSYDISCRTKIDAGYTYTRVEGGSMFGTGIGLPGSVAAGTAVGGNGFDGGFDIHEGRVGLRYALDDSNCHQPSAPVMVYK